MSYEAKFDSAVKSYETIMYHLKNIVYYPGFKKENNYN
jgi:hypothetical protein